MSGRRRRQHTNYAERDMAHALDAHAKYEEWKSEVLPKLQKMVASGSTAEDIYAFAQAYAAARMVTEALTNDDAAKALVALKDILDRTQGKAKERVDVRHKYENLTEEELQALLASKLADLKEDEPTDNAH